MENASKALLMAAGVLISLVIIGAFILMMSNVTDYQNKSDVQVASEQIAEFNNTYETYNRNNVRGSDMVSLMNRVLDYNQRKSEDGFTEMGIKIIISQEKAKKLAYKDTNKLVTKTEYTQENIDEIVGKRVYNKSKQTSNDVTAIEKRYKEAKYASQLAKEISNIEDIVNSSVFTSSSEKMEQFDNKKWLPYDLEDYGVGSVDEVYEDAKVYYEYVQFKRAKFKCTGTEYDKNSGRIINMKFECTGMGV